MANGIIRSAAVIADEINAIKTQTSGILSAALAYTKRSCFEIGKRLEEAKSIVGHGEWGAWLEENFEYSESTAGNLMRIYREFGGEQIDMLTGKSPAETFEGLSQSQLVELFALPRAERADFVEEHRSELEGGEMSIREMREKIRRLNETVAKQEKDIKDNDESYAELVAECRSFKKNAEASQTRIDELLLENEKLRSAEPPKPEVVHEPTKAQIKEIKEKAAAEVEKKYKDDIDKLAADLAAKDAERDAAVKAAEEEAAKKLRQAVGRSDPHAARVSFSMESIARALTDINYEIAAMEKEEEGTGTRLKGKCEASLLALLGRMGWQI